ncbi:MAG TPA: hypothetical protein VED86_00185 [archaeon]|nr:hypothetical protein [archaeon]
MISANDVLHAISEIHQYSMLLIEMKNATTVVIRHSLDGTMSYFKVEGSLKPNERHALAREMPKEKQFANLRHLTIEELMGVVDGQIANHIWLEAMGEDRKEHGFLSIAELKAFLRTNPQR